MSKAFQLGESVQYHPRAGGPSDGRIYKIRGFTTLGHGQRVALLEGRAGGVALWALCRPDPDLTDPPTARP